MPSVPFRPNPLLAAALASLWFPACNEGPDRSAWWKAEEERIELTQRLELALFQQRHQPTDLNPRLRELQTTARGLADRARTATQTRAGLAEDIRELERQLDPLARRALQDQQLSAIGLNYETLVLTNGGIFHGATVTHVDEVGVAIRHRDGLARLRCAELSPAQREAFGLDLATSLAAEASEQQAAIAYDRSISQALAAVRQQDEIARTAALSAEQTATRNRALLAAQTAAVARVSPLAQASNPQSRGWGSRRGSDPYRSHRPRFRTVYYYPFVSCSHPTAPLCSGNGGPQLRRTATPPPVHQPCPPSPPMP